MASLKEILSWFEKNKYPTQEQFKESWTSFWHKSEKLPMEQVVGLQDKFDDKADKADLASVVSGLIPMGSVANLTELETKPKRSNDAYYVEDQLSPEGDAYIYRWDDGLNLWVNTKQVVLSGEVAKKEQLEVLEKETLKLSKLWDYYGFVNKLYGDLDDSSNISYLYRSTLFLRILRKDNLIVTGYSGVNNNVVLVAFYDKSMKYLGYYNSNIDGPVSLHKIPTESIPKDAYYIKATRFHNQVGNLSGVEFDITMVSNLEEDKSKRFLYKDRGYINKQNGDIDISSVSKYSASKFLQILNKDNLIVSGYSGVNNNVALVAFYNEDFRYLGYYNSNTDGPVSLHKIPTESIPKDAYFIRFTAYSPDGGFIVGVDYKYNFGAYDVDKYIDVKLLKKQKEQIHNGFINKHSGSVSKHFRYGFSGLYKILNKNNLIVSGYSGANNDVALIAFYNSYNEYIGYYNVPNITDYVEDVHIPESAIPNSSYYVRISVDIHKAETFKVTGVEKVITLDTKESELIANSYVDRAFELSLKEAYSTIGYINKIDGSLNVTGEHYRASVMLEIIGNIIVTGFSGTKNNAALAYFYDSSFNPIDYYNPKVYGEVTDHEIPKEQVPTNAKYVRFTRTKSQLEHISGVSLNYKLPKLISYIDGKKDEISISKRSGRPNADSGGHIKLINYLGNDQNIHPKVLYFKNGFNGYNYWMAYTPYPQGNTSAENPSVAASVNGEVWITPEGLVNPLEFPPISNDNPKGYNSDTHLAYNYITSRLECWWRSYNPNTKKDSIKRRTSLDGIQWDDIDIIFDYTDHIGNIISPAVIFEDEKYKLWYVNDFKVFYRESTDGIKWSTPIVLDINFSQEGLTPWHLDVIHTDKGYEFIIQCWITSLGDNNSSDLYYVLLDKNGYSKPKLILERGDCMTDRDYLGIYRSSLVWLPCTKVNNQWAGGVYSIYYSAIANDFAFRAIYLTKGRALDRLQGVNL